MKRTISIILILLVVTTTTAFAVDYSAMTEEQLKEQYNTIRNELAIRGFRAESKTVIVDQDNFQIYINGDIRIEKRYIWDTSDCLQIPIVVVNGTTHNANMIVKNASMNGWSTKGEDNITSVPAGKKAKGYLSFELEDTDVETIADFSDVEFVLRVYDDNTWDDLFTTKPISIYAKQ